MKTSDGIIVWLQFFIIHVGEVVNIGTMCLNGRQINFNCNCVADDFCCCFFDLFNRQVAANQIQSRPDTTNINTKRNTPKKTETKTIDLMNVGTHFDEYSTESRTLIQKKKEKNASFLNEMSQLVSLLAVFTWLAR